MLSGFAFKMAAFGASLALRSSALSQAEDASSSISCAEKPASLLQSCRRPSHFLSVLQPESTLHCVLPHSYRGVGALRKNWVCIAHFQPKRRGLMREDFISGARDHGRQRTRSMARIDGDGP